jgi:peptidylprolyl isomerase
MKKLNKNQSIAVTLSLAFLAYLLYAGPLINMFTPTPSDQVGQPTSQVGVSNKDIVIGEGVSAQQGDILTVHYMGTLADGKVFDSSRDRNIPFRFTLGIGQVIRGWDEGIVGMNAGGKRVLVITPDYGYGQSGAGTIPPNATLIFEVELLNVEKSASR